MKKLFLYLGILSLMQNANAQKHISIQFTSQENIPTALFSETTKSYILKTSDIELQNILDKFVITKFCKKYPSAHLVKHKNAAALDRVYKIECLNNTIDLYNRLINIKKQSFENNLHLFAEPSVLAQPNDYNLLTYNYPTYNNFPITSSLQNDLINVSEAWDITTGNPNIRIAMTDLNFRRTHEELIDKISVDNASPYNPNYSDHGTLTASLAAGNTNNGVGIASVGYNCKMDLYDAFDYNTMLDAAMNGARVINCSWLTSCDYGYQNDQEIIDMIYDVYHTVIVAGAGNRNCGDTGHVFPASYNHVISVTRVGHVFNSSEYPQPPAHYKDLHSIFGWHLRNPGNKGELTHNSSVDISAPGTAVHVATGSSNNSYSLNGGTSFSAPMVAGAAALILSVNPNLLPDDVEAILKYTARDIYEEPLNIPYINLLGAGRLDVGKAVQLAQTYVPGTIGVPKPTPTDIRWFEILSNGVNTIEVESTCAANNNPGYCNIGYRLEVVGDNPNATYKWLKFYSEGTTNPPLSNSIKYGNTIFLTRGIDYPAVNNPTGTLKVCVRVNDFIPSIYYVEDRAALCLGDACSYYCPSDIFITGSYSEGATESYTWIKSIGQTTVDANTIVKLDASPTLGFVEFKPSIGNDYFVSNPNVTGSLVVQAFNGCDGGTPARVNNNFAKNETKIQPVGKEILIFPNPSNGIITIENLPLRSKIEVFDIVGKKVFSTQSINHKYIGLNLSSFSSGTYFININKKLIKKIVKY